MTRITVMPSNAAPAPGSATIDHKRRGLPCPYCDFVIAKGLLWRRLMLACPQCGRALRVSRQFLVPTGVILASLVWLATLWVSRVRGLWWVFNSIVMTILAAHLLPLVSLLLPRQLVPRYRNEDAHITTLEISAPDKPEIDG